LSVVTPLPTAQAPGLPYPQAVAMSRTGRPSWLIPAIAGLALVGGAAAWWTLGRSVLEITSVRGAQPVLVGDGRPQALMLGYEARRAPLRSIEVRHVRGGGPWAPAQWSVPVETSGGASGQAARGEIAAGTLQQVVAQPTSVTFEYTLVGLDGLRSAPFEQTFNLLPPLTLSTAKWSAPPRLGQPLTVQLGWRKGAGDVVQVRRRVVASSTPWPAGEQTTAVQLAASSGQLELPIDGPPQPLQATLEFELVDTLGVHSPPVQLALNLGGGLVTSGPATVVSVVALGGSLRNVPIGAVAGGIAGAAAGNQFGRGRGRTAATVTGGVLGMLAGQQIERQVRGPNQWETVVRFDAGNTRRLRHAEPPRWAVGQRVQVSPGGAIQG
jgi:outer membrane lipoprotein SlyB